MLVSPTPVWSLNHWCWYDPWTTGVGTCIWDIVVVGVTISDLHVRTYGTANKPLPSYTPSLISTNEQYGICFTPSFVRRVYARAYVRSCIIIYFDFWPVVTYSSFGTGTNMWGVCSYVSDCSESGITTSVYVLYTIFACVAGRLGGGGAIGSTLRYTCMYIHSTTERSLREKYVWTHHCLFNAIRLLIIWMQTT